MTNVAPSGTDQTITLLENAEHVFTSADFGFSDADGNALLAVEIAALPVAGQLLANGVAVTAGQFISISDITNKKLVFTPATGATGTPYATFTFQVQDNGSTTNGGQNLDLIPRTMTINVQ